MEEENEGGKHPLLFSPSRCKPEWSNLARTSQINWLNRRRRRRRRRRRASIRFFSTLAFLVITGYRATRLPHFHPRQTIMERVIFHRHCISPFAVSSPFLSLLFFPLNVPRFDFNSITGGRDTSRVNCYRLLNRTVSSSQ